MGKGYPRRGAVAIGVIGLLFACAAQAGAATLAAKSGKFPAVVSEDP